MNYKALWQLFQSTTPTPLPIKVGLIGSGAFGKSFLFQARVIPQLEITVVCDREVAVARQACLAAGIPEAQLAPCHTAAEAQKAMEAGKTALIEQGELMLALPSDGVNVVVEATGMPEAGARHGKLALEGDKHVVMVTKETDAVVGPILTKLAQERNLVYTQADGDQPSMLIGLISWAETLGLEIVCAGKSNEQDFVYDRPENIIRHGRQTVPLAGDEPWALWSMPAGQARSVVEKRSQALKAIPQGAVSALCEMAIVMNATGYGYDRPALWAPIVRIPEIPEVLCGRQAGGLLERAGGIDIVNCLREKEEVSFAGGVFVVVKCKDEETWALLRRKGHVVSRDGSHALIFQPYHLLGVETATTILAAAILNLPTGGIDVRPRVALGARTSVPLPAGRRLLLNGGHAIPDIAPELVPPTPIAPDNAIPFYMAAQNSLKTDLPAGALLTYGMLDYNSDTPLWELKRLQDEAFLEGVDFYE